MGIGIHGEPGRARAKLKPADEITADLVAAICESVEPKSGDDVLLMINGMGGTPAMELYLMYDAAARQCADRGLAIARSLVGNYCTSLEMAGCSVTITRLDDEMMDLWDAPVHTAALRWGV